MRHRLTWFGFLVAGLLGGASIGIVACADQVGDHEALPECALPADSVSPELLAFLSKARASHLQADIALKDDQPEVALAALDKLVDGPLPTGRPSPEAREVLADTLARCAEIRSTIGKFDEAKADIDRGLKLAVERTHYRGRLMEVLGAVEQRLHDKLIEDLATQSEAGADESVLAEIERAADEAKQNAIKASMDAIDIQEEVIDKALAEQPDGPGQDAE